MEPPGASLDTFDWRISVASIATDGPFSKFPGIDRTLAVVKGKGLLLTIGSSTAVSLERGSDPIAFDGDVPTSAHLTQGEIIDLNVMSGADALVIDCNKYDNRLSTHSAEITLRLSCP